MAAQPTSSKKRSAEAEIDQPRPAKRTRYLPDKSPVPRPTITVSKMRTAEEQPWMTDPGYDISARVHQRMAPSTTKQESNSEIRHPSDNGRVMRDLSTTTTLHHELLPLVKTTMPTLRKSEMELAILAKEVARECFPDREEKIQRDALRCLIGWFGRKEEEDKG